MKPSDIDVVMPIYNAERYLELAVRSLLQQTYPNFRIVCIDDGSTDGSSDILAALAREDSRVAVFRQENKGLVGALNAGLSQCTAPLVARMDADDIAMPERFRLQREFLNSHSDVVAVGAAILELDSDGEALGVDQFGSTHEAIERDMLRTKTGMAHPTVMMRREVVDSLGGYRLKYEWIEDLDLWLRMAEVGRLANLPEVLLCYRQHGSSGTWSVGQKRRERLVALMEEAHQRRGLQLPSSLVERCMARRSPSGPNKWARKASRNGQWGVALKHLARQWSAAPLSLLTWRITVEATLRSATYRLRGADNTLPEVPEIKRAA
ncbi:glycosyltransferase [Aporhodopirellula aestuarii]|uniref:Glycosyltransferase n=1 Tax=Aporhodopirellula aestuarii TaxID=2950107 RepID=A0ABT0U5I9_9BACT|nr:glycosyltransferase [Aporhodopirellula aestuarii]MCM2372202.1 glycosyltransferase [Aporhodopirellula aestuarii]